MKASLNYLNIAGVFLLFLTLCKTASGDDFDLDEVVKQHVEEISKKYRTDVLWFDIYGNRVFNAGQNAAKSGLYVTATTGPIEYGPPKISKSQPNILYREWFHNGQPTSTVKAVVRRTTDLQTKHFWRTKEGFRSGFRLQAGLQIPYVSFGGGYERMTNLTTENVTEISESDSYSVERVIDVPPKRSVEVEWVVTDVFKEYPWTAEVALEGYFAVMFKKRVKGIYLRLFPIKEVRHPSLRTLKSGQFGYISKGVYTGASATDSKLRVLEYDLEAYSPKPLNITVYPIRPQQKK